MFLHASEQAMKNGIGPQNRHEKLDRPEQTGVLSKRLRLNRRTAAVHRLRLAEREDEEKLHALELTST